VITMGNHGPGSTRAADRPAVTSPVRCACGAAGKGVQRYLDGLRRSDKC
jgi:hypothetical protein